MEQFKLAKLYDATGDLSKVWYVYFSYLHPETKQFIRLKRPISSRLRTRTARHQRAAVLIRDINIRLKTGWNPLDSENLAHTSIEEAILKVIELKKSILRIRTLHTYEHLARMFIRWLRMYKLQNIYVGSFSFIHAQQFLDWTKSVKKVQNRTYNNYITHMKVFFNFLIEREYTDANPFKKCRKLPKDEAEISTFTRRELDIMKENLPRDNYQLWACAQLIYYCFIRPAEIMRLKAKDIDIERGIICVHGYLSKNRKDAIVVMPDPMIETFKEMKIEEMPSDQYLFTRHLKPGYKEAAPTRMAGLWREWADRYGIKKRIYDLKHTGAGMAIESGINIRDLQLQLRHHSLEMTQVYLDKFRRDPGELLRAYFPRI